MLVKAKLPPHRGGVCSRRDRAHSRGQAWRPFRETGRGDRAVKGPARGSKAAASRGGQGVQEHADSGGTRLCHRARIVWTEGLAETVAGHHSRALAGRPSGSVSPGAFSPSARECPKSQCRKPKSRGPAGCPHERHGRASKGGAKGGSHASDSQGIGPIDVSATGAFGPRPK